MKNFYIFLLALALGLTIGCSQQRGGERDENATGAANNQDQPATAANNNAGSSLAAADQQFLTFAAQSGHAEVELGQLASERASDPQVKQFAQKMIDDHNTTNERLMQVAERFDMSLPEEPNAEGMSARTRLEGLQGAAFDRAYMQQMVQDHQKTVNQFQDASNSSNQDVNNFAQQNLPALQQHLDQAQQIASKLGGGGQ